MKKFLLAVQIIFISTIQAFSMDADFKELSKAEHIYGEKIDASALKGKVVFLEYWGIQCPPCRASIPHLVDLQTKHEKTRKFTVLASHVQSDSNAAKKFCETNKVNFPVFQQFIESAAPCGNGIPCAFIIDHTGKVVETGNPMELIKKVDDYLKKVPNKYFMISNTEVILWKNQAKSLAPNKPVLQILNQLKLAAEKDDEKGKEAKAIVEEIEKYLKETDAILSTNAEKQPTQTLLDAQDFLLLCKGMEMENNTKTLVDKLKSDPEVLKFIPVLKELRQVQGKIQNKATKALEKQLTTVKQKIEKFKNSSSPTVAEEAKAVSVQ